MKTIALNIFLLLHLYIFGQNSNWHLQGLLPDSSVKAFVVDSLDAWKFYALVYKNGNQSDTLKFHTKAQEYLSIDTFNLKAIQIDGKGLKEIVISWKLTDDMECYNYDREEFLSVNKIWNLDTREELFSSIDKYFRCYNDLSRDEKEKTIDTVSYAYNFSVDSLGQIRINDVTTNCSHYVYYRKFYRGIWKIKNCKMDPEVASAIDPCNGIVDKKEGVYIFKNGKYILLTK